MSAVESASAPVLGGVPPETARPARGAGVTPILVSLAVALAFWWLAAGNLLEHLPTPGDVASEFEAAVTSSAFYGHMADTLRRVGLAWLGAYVAALIIGIAMARSWLFETVAHPWVFVGLALPGPVSILFAILALGLGEFTSLVALWVAVTPFIITFVYDGSRALDPKLFQMASVYRMGPVAQVRHVILPQLAPALLSGARFGFAMSWKLVVLVEALSATSGIGERLEYFFSFNRPDAVIAWTLSFTVVMILVELLVFRTVSKRLFRWRPKAAS